MESMQYELVITPAPSRRSWLPHREPEEAPGVVTHRGPQIQRASFFPSRFGLSGAAGARGEGEEAGALHAVKRSEGLLAKEYVILTQKLPRIEEDATSLAHVSAGSSGQGHTHMGPHSISARGGAPAARVAELFPGARRAASTSGRFAGGGAPGAPRRLTSPEAAAWEGEPKVAAVLRGSSSGSHYLLAACTPKQEEHTGPAYPEEAEGEAEEAAFTRPGSSEGRRARKKTRVARHGEFQMLQGEEGPGGRRGGAAAEERRVVGPTYWGAARRRAVMLSACWMGSGYELATTDAREEEEQEAAVRESQSGAHPSHPHSHPHLQPHFHSDRYSDSHSPHTDPLGRSDSLTSPEGTSSFPSSTSAGSLGSSGGPSKGTPSGPLGGRAGDHLVKVAGSAYGGAILHGALPRRLSPPKERSLPPPPPQPSTFVGVPELAIRFFRPGATGSKGRKAARAMGPGEGYMSLPLEGHDSSREWVMEGIPAAAFQNTSGVACARSWAKSAIQDSASEIQGSPGSRDEALPNVWGAPQPGRGNGGGGGSGSSPGTPGVARQRSFMGEPGSHVSDCILEVYGDVPCRPALQMFASPNTTHARSITFSVVVDPAQMTPMHAFVSCLARADSLVAGGLMAQH